MSPTLPSRPEVPNFILIHTHRFGESTYLISATHLPDENELIRHCQIDYEPNRDESLEIYSIDNEGVVVIPPK